MNIPKSRSDFIDTNNSTSQPNNNESMMNDIDAERSDLPLIPPDISTDRIGCEELEPPTLHSLAASQTDRISEDTLSSSRIISWPGLWGGSVKDDLINSVKGRDWDEARALLRRSDARSLVQYTNAYNNNALHVACYHCAPSDIIQAMIDTSTRALLEQDRNAWTPLHHAIMRSSEEIMIMLLEACPQAALIANNYGRTPLHTAINNNASLNVIHRLLAANPTAATTTDYNRDTPLHMLFGRWNASLRKTLDSINGDKKVTDDVILREIYQTFLLLLQAATYGSIEDNQESTFRPLCAAMNDPRCPWSFVSLILRMDPKEASRWDREGNLPIHVAAAAATLSVDKILAVIRDLLATNTTFAEIPDSEGRLPLHITIENEKPFKEGLEAIVRAAPKALNTRDIMTHLYPFMLGAVEHDRTANELQKFTSCFALLMDNPHFVSSGIPH